MLKATALILLTLCVTVPALAAGVEGIRINPDDMTKLEFLTDKELTKDDVEYFLAGVTIPEKDLWVDLSPEKGQVLPPSLERTALGRVFLEQDYQLKQEAARLAVEQGIKADVTGKIWIVYKQALVNDSPTEGRIMQASLGVRGELPEDLLRQIEWLVNYSPNFKEIRKAYRALILGVWFKKKIENSLDQYVDRSKINGIVQPSKKAEVWEKYFDSFRSAANRQIRSEYNKVTRRYERREYFAGGINMAGFNKAVLFTSSPMKAWDKSIAMVELLPKFGNVRTLLKLVLSATAITLLSSCAEQSYIYQPSIAGNPYIEWDINDLAKQIEVIAPGDNLNASYVTSSNRRYIGTMAEAIDAKVLAGDYDDSEVPELVKQLRHIIKPLNNGRFYPYGNPDFLISGGAGVAQSPAGPIGYNSMVRGQSDSTVLCPVDSIDIQYKNLLGLYHMPAPYDSTIGEALVVLAERHNLTAEARFLVAHNYSQDICERAARVVVNDPSQAVYLPIEAGHSQFESVKAILTSSPMKKGGIELKGLSKNINASPWHFKGISHRPLLGMGYNILAKEKAQ